MALDYQEVADELNTDPLVRGYLGMTDQQAADDISRVFYRPAPGGVDAMLAYCLTTKNRTNLGTDLTGSSIMGRLRHVADAAVGSDPFGQAGGYTLAAHEKHAAAGFVDLLQSPQLVSVDFLNTELDGFYIHCTNAGIWKTADADALKALSQNKRTRAMELGWPTLGSGDISIARAL